ncbi:O-antigen ligase family protein [Candidatus Daviesbacteria bacterium]|nr:O-antigen ligase family protein [Candidatus Daviesbacteria bacterium]
MKRIESILLFLTLLFLPTQLGRHFWPQFSYIYSLKIDYLSPTLYFWDILVIGLLITWVITKPKVNKLALNLLLIFLITQALSLLGAENIGAGLVRLEQYVIAGFLGVYLASQRWENLNRIFLPLSVGILFEAGLAILQFIKGGTLGLWILGERTFSISTPGIAKFDFFGWQFLRPYATFPHPNVLAGYMIVVLSLLSSRILLIIGGIIIVLTMSRVAILGGFILGLLTLPKKWQLILLVSALLLSPILYTRFQALFSYDSLTILRREGLSIEAWEMFKSAPLFGVGLNNFISAQQDLVSGPSRFLQPVHNIFLLELSETGIIGLIGFIGLIGYFLKLPSIRYTLYAILFLGLFDHYFLTLPQGYRLLFLVWGLSLARLKLK